MAQSEVEKQLADLERLKARGTITEDEYAERRRAIISSPVVPTAAKKRSGIFKWGLFGCLGIFAAIGLVLVILAVVIVAAVGSSAGEEGKDVHVALAEGSSGVVWPGNLSDKRSKVTLLKIVDNATSTNQFEKPAAGNKFYAIQIEVENVGKQEVIGLDWKLRDSKDGEFNDRLLSGVGGQHLAFTTDLTPGGKVQGWIVFEIPADSTVKWIRADPNVVLKNDLYFDQQ